VHLQTVLRNPPESCQFGEITPRLGLLRRSRSSKVTDQSKAHMRLRISGQY